MENEERLLSMHLKPQMTMNDLVVVLKAKTGKGSQGTVKNLWRSGQLAYHVRRAATDEHGGKKAGHGKMAEHGVSEHGTKETVKACRGTRYSTPEQLNAYLKKTMNVV